MHCEDPGCLRACPADGAIVQYTNGIVDFQQENCIGCQYCVSGCPFDIPKFNSDEEGLQVHALLRSRRAGTRAGVHQGVSDRLPALRHEGRHARARRRARAAAARALRVSPTRASTIRRRSAARTSSTCCTTSPSPSCTADCRRTRSIPPTYTVWKRVAKPIGLLLALVRRAGRVLPLRDGRAEGAAAADSRGAAMTTRSNGSTTAPAGASARSGARSCTRTSCCGIRSTRACCTGRSAIFFVLALLSGFAIYSPWLFRWLTPLFGGGPMTRLLHPWFSLGFVVAFASSS